MFKWKKIGQIFNPVKMQPEPWMMEYAQVPSTLIFKNFVRIYFTCRPQRGVDGKHISYSGFVDIRKDNLFEIINISKEPLFELGALGTFDEHGSMVCSVVNNENKFFAYYVGWSRLDSVPYNCAIGVATSTDGTNFKKVGKSGPLLSATVNEPFLLGCPRVSIIDNVWHMWYISGDNWIEYENRKESIYSIRHATSNNGLEWKRDGVSIIPKLYDDECLTSPCVFKYDDAYHMFFTTRRGFNFRNKERGYRIGYAYSKDLKKWTREDSKSGIDISENGWDSEMVCYPHVFNLEGKVYLLYCGNYFGKEGFGIAELITN